MLILNDFLLYSFGPKGYQILSHIGIVKPCLFFPPSVVSSITGNAMPATSILKNFKVNQEWPGKQQSWQTEA